ncbi:hypothetical protein CLV43_108252 [Umezawaea tangerina]|uniref:Uncharacterized protein n=1 Tax=Umezawaea tangerina TaxID=84725 RepID=A0A2T0SZK4_9PSEU|nr:hypothetical protein CLV43_108252 [Umezawaea tangerina]
MCSVIDTKAVSKRLTGIEEAVVAVAPLLPTPPQSAGCEATGSNAQPADLLRIILTPAVQNGIDVFATLKEKPGAATMNVNGIRLVWVPDEKTLHARFLNRTSLAGGTSSGRDSLVSITCVNTSPQNYTSCDDEDVVTSESRDVLTAVRIVRGIMAASQTSPPTGTAQLDPANYAGEWMFHGTTIKIGPDLRGSVSSNLGPCTGAVGFCEESGELEFLPTDDGLIGFYVSLSYSMNGSPVSEVPKYVHQVQDSFRFKKVDEGLYSLVFLRSAGRPLIATDDGVRYLCGISSPPKAVQKCGGG